MKKPRPTVASLAKELVTLRENAALRDRKHDSLVRALGGHNPDPRGLHAIQELERQLELRREGAELLSHRIDKNYNDVRSNATRIEKKLDDMREVVNTLGPLWKTQNGHRVPIMMLSTEHLDRLDKGNWVKDPATKRAITTELDRRRIDAEWRRGEHTPWCGGSFEEPELTPDQIRISMLEEMIVERVAHDSAGKIIHCIDKYGRRIMSYDISNMCKELAELRGKVDELEDDVIEDDPPHVGPDFISHIVYPHKCEHEFGGARPVVTLSDDRLKEMHETACTQNDREMQGIIEREMQGRGRPIISPGVFEAKTKAKHDFSDLTKIVKDMTEAEDDEDLEVEISSAPIEDLRSIRVGGITVRLPFRRKAPFDPVDDREFLRQQAKKRKRKSRIAAAWRAFWKSQSDLGCAG